jgi:hypothetical protein
MLDTLYKFGRQLSQNSDREEFDDQIAIPPIDEKEIAKGIRFFVATIIFDLDTGTFRLDENPKPFSQADKTYKFSPYNLRCIKIQGGNNKSIYPTVDPRKAFDQWQKTFFGKRDKDGNPPKQAELTEAIQKDFADGGINNHYRNYPDINFKNWQQSYYGKNLDKLQTAKRK